MYAETFLRYFWLTMQHLSVDIENLTQKYNVNVDNTDSTQLTTSLLSTSISILKRAIMANDIPFTFLP